MNDTQRRHSERVNADGVASFISRISAAHKLSDLTFLCIGTDRSSGDCLGPLVGTMLEERGVTNVIGTLKEPCDADKLPSVAAALPLGRPVVAIDACLGRTETIGLYVVAEGPLEPAKSVGKRLPSVGAYSIAAIVNSYGPKPYASLQSTSLYRVMNMAHDITDAIIRHLRP
ncbi:spore protease YyaC [Cohnella faecalis]|uniref:Spore protease YyaC n=1 Tax=Cohnella faecalis TaxID=2315694 RepID=A0A398CKF3_9BACL|nr:spore protease YyaC [Cohnella faecalis]RIE02632.1 spore protease YyaC [Cohnella faecalis]